MVVWVEQNKVTIDYNQMAALKTWHILSTIGKRNLSNYLYADERRTKAVKEKIGSKLIHYIESGFNLKKERNEFTNNNFSNPFPIRGVL